MRLLDFETATKYKEGKNEDKRDVWNCGALLYTILTGKKPFNGRSEKEIFLKNGNKPISHDPLIKIVDKSRESVDLIRRTVFEVPE